MELNLNTSNPTRNTTTLLLFDITQNFYSNHILKIKHIFYLTSAGYLREEGSANSD